MNQTYKSYPKVNIFLKIVGHEDGYHQLISRFIKVKNFHDVMWFEPSDGKGFTVTGDFDCDVESNTIYKAYLRLKEHYSYRRIDEFCQTHKVVVYKNIPSKAGLGGGSSNAATFLQMINEKLGLKLSNKNLIEIGQEVGADVPFFLSGYDSANVRGFGQIIEEYKEELPELDIFTPNIECDTSKIFRAYRQKFSHKMQENSVLGEKLALMDSRDILLTYKPEELNDLFPAALKAQSELIFEQKEGYFFSGSGSSFFKLL